MSESTVTRKNLLMLAALAVVIAAGTACFQAAKSDKLAKDAEVPDCAGLGGQAKADCEAQHRPLK